MIGFIVSYIYVFLILVIGMRIEKYGKEKSRKFVHIMTANWWFIVMIFFKSPFWPVMVTLSFIFVNIVTYRYSLFTCIERENGARDKGTIYYGVTLLILVLLSFYYEDMLIGLTGSLVMGYADGLAALCGQKFNWIPYHVRGNKKSFSGSLMMFVVTVIVTGAILKYAGYSNNLYSCLLMGILATYLEAISDRGKDNLIVPLSVAGMYILLFK